MQWSVNLENSLDQPCEINKMVYTLSSSEIQPRCNASIGIAMKTKYRNFRN